MRYELTGGGGGDHVHILNKERGSLAIYIAWRGEREFIEILIFPTYFSLPPLFINNDQSLQ